MQLCLFAPYAVVESVFLVDVSAPDQAILPVVGNTVCRWAACFFAAIIHPITDSWVG